MLPVQVYNPAPGICPGAPASRGYAGGFAAALMLKDLNLALEASNAVGATLPATATAATWYSLAAAATEKGAGEGLFVRVRAAGWAKEAPPPVILV